MKRLALLAIAITTVAAAAGRATPAAARQWGTTIPAHCTAHTSFNGGADVPGDYRCAGLAIEYHTGGVALSPFPIWAGQWLFTDEAGQFRLGYCTLNRGNHPTIAVASHTVAQVLPNDPTGGRSAYLAWRYGDTTDDLTAAAMWAVMHFYAADAAGTNRSARPTAPLVPSLTGLQLDSGRADLQQRAIALDAEAATFAAAWVLAVSVTPDGTATATLTAGDHPVPGQEITVLVSGSDVPHAATTGTDGTATVTLPITPGTVTVAATAAAPGPALVYRGQPASPDPDGAQLQLTAGTPRTLRATASVEVAPPPTTAPPTTTTSPATTTTSPATTLPATTTTTTAAAPSTTAPPATTTTLPSTTTSAPTPTSAVVVPPPDSAAPPSPLPRTGGGGGAPAYLGTALLVGGVGLLGTLRRRTRGRARTVRRWT